MNGSPSMRRRTFLAGVAGVLVSTTLGAREASADSTFDDLRTRWTEWTLLSTLPANDPDYLAAISTIDTQAVAARPKITLTATDRVFTDLPFVTSTAMVGSYSRLLQMTRAYRLVGTSMYNDSAVSAEVLAALRRMHDLVYYPGRSQFDNWYHWEISGPRALLDMCIYLHTEMDPADRTDYLAAVNYFNSDPEIQMQIHNVTYPTRVPAVSEGSNRILLCVNKMLEGIAGDSSAALTLASNGIVGAMQYGVMDTTQEYGSNMGLYPDGSFIFQSHVAYNGSYGIDYLTGTSTLLGMLSGTTWEVTDPAKDNVLAAVNNAFQPWIFNGRVMDAVAGRSIARAVESTGGLSALIAILELPTAATPTVQASWKRMCKGWLTRYAALPTVLANQSAPRISRIKALMADNSITADPEPTGALVFPRMGRATYRGNGWAASFSVASIRTANYDYGNGENLKGFHTGSGMIHLYLDNDQRHYDDTYWPTTNYYGLPGTTLDTQPLPDGAGGSSFGRTRPTNAWAGGTTLNDTLAFGVDFDGVATTLACKKSWFCLNGQIIALGAGITGGSGANINTTIELRRLSGAADNDLHIDGVLQPATLGWSANIAGASWAHLEGVGGYLFLEGTSGLTASRANRTGSWSLIRTGGATTLLTAPYLQLQIEHGGTAITIPHYAYVMMPAATPSQTASAAASTNLTLLANTATAQAIHDSATDTTMINTYSAATVGDHQLSGPASLIARRTSGQITVSIADPTHAQANLTLVLANTTLANLNGDSTITAAQIGPDVHLTIDTGDHDGRSHRTVVTTL